MYSMYSYNVNYVEIHTQKNICIVASSVFAKYTSGILSTSLLRSHPEVLIGSYWLIYLYYLVVVIYLTYSI